MAGAYLSRENRGSIAVITINRPEAMNALNKHMLEDLARLLVEIKDDASCRAVIITGSGSKVFSAGADVNTFIEEIQKPLGGKEWSKYGQNIFSLLDLLGKPSVAAVNGLAIGGGFELALACTFRIASENAAFSFPEIALGFLPGWGGTVRLTKLIGKSRAAELILTGDRISAHEALRLGIVSKVVPYEELLASSLAFLERITRHSPVAVRVALEALHYSQFLSMEESLNLESNLGGLACASEDAKEGLAAFLEKRQPQFKGR